MERQENNNVHISGKIEGEFQYAHKLYGEKFYRNRIIVKRLSGTEDYIPIIISNRIIELGDLNSKELEGVYVKLEGKFRSYKIHDNDGREHLILQVFVTDIEILEDQENSDINEIILEGCISQKPIFRKTSLGKEITQILLEVNRWYNKNDYIPCITWGRNARYLNNFEIGDKVKFIGRIQSREYEKKISETEYTDKKTAYEVSVRKIRL